MCVLNKYSEQFFLKTRRQIGKRFPIISTDIFICKITSLKVERPVHCHLVHTTEAGAITIHLYWNNSSLCINTHIILQSMKRVTCPLKMAISLGSQFSLIVQSLFTRARRSPSFRPPLSPLICVPISRISLYRGIINFRPLPLAFLTHSAARTKLFRRPRNPTQSLSFPRSAGGTIMEIIKCLLHYPTSYSLAE